MVIRKQNLPAISVVMPVYNCEDYVEEAIRSILDQTFYDFEFIIIDDGSTDRSFEIVRQFNDKRIRLNEYSENRGNYSCRNAGLKLARGKYICVMDADDISEPDRLKKQFQFMENNPDIGICGSFIKNIPSNSTPRFITDSDQLKVAFLSNNYCSHPSLIMKKEFLDKYNLRYNEDFIYSADFDLCARALRFLKVQNIPDVLLQYRRHPGQISSAKYKEQQRYADVIRINQLIDNLDFTLKEIPVLLHLKLMKRQHLLFRYKPKAEQWVMRILEKNDTIGYYNQKILKEFLFYCISASLIFSNQKKSVTH